MLIANEQIPFVNVFFFKPKSIFVEYCPLEAYGWHESHIDLDGFSNFISENGN